VWTASNHDVGRFPTRWCGGDERKVRLALLVLATLPGTTVLYYGDEIGMTNVAVPPELRQDKMTRDVAQGGRDRGRTPMPWDASAAAGFTADGVKPWLPLGDTAACNVAGQRQDPASVLSFCRSLLALRRAELGGQVAAYESVPAAEGLWAYRVGGLTVTGNFTDAPAAQAGTAGEVLLSTHGQPPPAGRLRPWEGVVTRPGA
jgi:alpha-glucosidase